MLNSAVWSLLCLCRICTSAVRKWDPLCSDWPVILRITMKLLVRHTGRRAKPIISQMEPLNWWIESISDTVFVYVFVYSWDLTGKWQLNTGDQSVQAASEGGRGEWRHQQYSRTPRYSTDVSHELRDVEPHRNSHKRLLKGYFTAGKMVFWSKMVLHDQRKQRKGPVTFPFAK